MRTVLKAVGGLIALVLAAAVLLIALLTITEFNSKETEAVAVTAGSETRDLAPGGTLSVLTWNVGYGALGDNADFFMDGGKMVQTADQARVESNLSSLREAISSLSPDLCFLQEVDLASGRSRNINERESLSPALPGYASAFAENFKVMFVPYPIPPIGKVDSGLLTLSSLQISSAERIALPCPFSWPIRVANLKRCLLVSRIPLSGTDKELVAVNLHLEAYDDGAGKTAQTRQLADFLAAEADRGNYVIAGGDFNQLFSNVDAGAYPVYPDRWTPGLIDAEAFDSRFSLLMDNRVPTCRSLDQPYAGADHSQFQYYLIDGFIVSSNITVNTLETRNYNFAATDHNPVYMEITLTP